MFSYNTDEVLPQPAVPYVSSNYQIREERISVSKRSEIKVLHAFSLPCSIARKLEPRASPFWVRQQTACLNSQRIYTQSSSDTVDPSRWLFLFKFIGTESRWSWWPRGLRRWSAAARLLRLWIRIPPGAWMFVCCEYCVLSGRGLCGGADHWSRGVLPTVVRRGVWSRNLVN